jgi:hypothetical protein
VLQTRIWQDYGLATKLTRLIRFLLAEHDTADCAGNRVACATEAETLRDFANGIAADGACDQLNDQPNDIHALDTPLFRTSDRA